MPKHPLAEVFGFPASDMGRAAKRARKLRLCPFGNRVPNCTKDKANDPLGVCSIHDGREIAITCPIRFRQDWLIAEDAASFFFSKTAKWTTLTEVKLKDKHGKAAGNVDVVLVRYNDKGKVVDFGALEVQAVYISGNVRNPFEHYMESPERRHAMDWTNRPNNPRPDYLSSSRKRLAPQLIFKGGIFKAWNKKIAVALNKGFFETLPALKQVAPDKADIAWFVYDLKPNRSSGIYELKRHRTFYTEFHDSLEKITRSEPGDVNGFMRELQNKVDEKLETGRAPRMQTIDALL